MALEENSGMGTTMLVSPTGGNGGFGGGFGGDWGWIILLLLLAGGNGFGGWGGGNAAGYDFPWLLNGQNAINANTNNGFQNALLNDNITGIRDAIGGISTQLCGAFATAEASANARQIADMQTAFAAQTATAQGFNNISGQLSTCCCENRLATCQTQNLVSREGAETRLALEKQTQAILDKLCAQEIDQLKSANLSLQNQLNIANLAASQTAQTAALIADNTAQTQYIVNRVAPYPIPAYTVANPVTPAT